MWGWLQKFLFGLLSYVFVCVVCMLEQTFKAETKVAADRLAERAGWRRAGSEGAVPAGWRCSRCARDLAPFAGP